MMHSIETTNGGFLVRKVMQLGFAAAVLAACSFVSSTPLRGADEEKPKTIKEVMKLVFKKNALKDKAVMGEASDEEKKALVALLKDMAAGKPPKGSEESWKKHTAALVEAAEGVAENKEGAADSLRKASNCASCHREHKKG